MPFDGTDYRGPIRPERSSSSEGLITAAILVFALVLLLMPVSLSGMVDLISYLRRL
jgi:hypothetical protein